MAIGNDRFLTPLTRKRSFPSVMRSPILYLSHSFKRHQREYDDRLSAGRTNGDWEGWTQFHLACVEEAAEGRDVFFPLIPEPNRPRVI